jgi:hypothetical protein
VEGRGSTAKRVCTLMLKTGCLIRADAALRETAVEQVTFFNLS